MRREWMSSVKSKKAVTNLRLYQHSLSISASPLSLYLCMPATGFPLLNWVVVVVRNGFSRHVTIMDWSRLSLFSPRLAVCCPVPSGHPVRLDWTEPYPRLGSSGLVESLEVRRPGAREEVYKRSEAAVVKAEQRVQLQRARPPASLHIPREALYVPWLHTQWNGFQPEMGESRWCGSTSVYTLITVFVLVCCFW